MNRIGEKNKTNLTLLHNSVTDSTLDADNPILSHYMTWGQDVISYFVPARKLEQIRAWYWLTQVIATLSYGRAQSLTSYFREECHRRLMEITHGA